MVRVGECDGGTTITSVVVEIGVTTTVHVTGGGGGSVVVGEGGGSVVVGAAEVVGDVDVGVVAHKLPAKEKPATGVRHANKDSSDSTHDAII